MEYKYDNYGRVLSIQGFVKDVIYKNNDFINKINYTNGIETNYIPDELYRIKNIQSDIMDYCYKYDGKGNVESFATHDPKDPIDLIDPPIDPRLPIGVFSIQTSQERSVVYNYASGELNLLTSVNGSPVIYDK